MVIQKYRIPTPQQKRQREVSDGVARQHFLIRLTGEALQLDSTIDPRQAFIQKTSELQTDSKPKSKDFVLQFDSIEDPREAFIRKTSVKG